MRSSNRALGARHVGLSLRAPLPVAAGPATAELTAHGARSVSRLELWAQARLRDEFAPKGRAALHTVTQQAEEQRGRRAGRREGQPRQRRVGGPEREGTKERGAQDPELMNGATGATGEAMNMARRGTQREDLEDACNSRKLRAGCSGLPAGPCLRLVRRARALKQRLPWWRRRRATPGSCAVQRAWAQRRSAQRLP